MDGLLMRCGSLLKHGSENEIISENILAAMAIPIHGGIDDPAAFFFR